MSADSSQFGSAAETPALRLIGSLANRYIAILVAVGLLLTIDQAILQPRLERLSVYAPRINVAGRQRMLSQRLVKASLAWQAATDPAQRQNWQNQLTETLAQWQAAHHGLLDGDPTAGLPQTTSPEIRAAFGELNPHFVAMSQAAKDLTTADDPQVPLSALLENEAKYLPLMDSIVGMYEHEARSQALTIRTLGLAAAIGTVVLLIAMGYIVLLPAMQTIRLQMKELETRVAERTAELTTANESLRNEIVVRRAAEERTRELSAQLAHTSRVFSMGQLATGLAHEINQPLAAIANYSEMVSLMLENEPVDLIAVQQALESIGKSAVRAGDIVRSMRNFMRPGEVPKTRVDLHDLVQEVILLCRPELTQNQVDWKLDLQPEPIPLLVASTQIQQVLVNLIQNAIEAMHEVPPSERMLNISTQLFSDHVQIEVSDRGHGLGDREPESLFQPFLTTKDSGMGMGLSIVRSIVQEHGGRVWAENRKPGAAVSFTIPLESEHERRVIAEADRVCSG